MSENEPSPRRFTVLHHTGVDDPHYDFLFETSETSQLITFRLQSWPMFASQPAKKLRDHRRAYLDYVGPVSGDRGRVDRVDEGRLRVIQTSEGWTLFQEDGRAFLRMERARGGEEDEWFLTLLG